MAEDKELKQAQNLYKALCEWLDEHDWDYKKFENDFVVKCLAQGDDLPIELVVQIDTKHQLISLMSPMPFPIAEDRRSVIAVAVSQANVGLITGNFDFNYLNGQIIFRIASSYRESLIGKDMFEYLLLCACYTIDEYNDKFLTVAKSKMSIEEVLDYIC